MTLGIEIAIGLALVIGIHFALNRRWIRGGRSTSRGREERSSLLVSASIAFTIMMGASFIFGSGLLLIGFAYLIGALLLTLFKAKKSRQA